MIALFTNPLLPVFLLLVIAVVWHRRIRLLSTISLLALLLVSAPFGPRLVMRAWAVEDSFSPARHYDAVLPLGGIIDFKWYQSRTGKPLLPAYYRFNHNGGRIIAAVDLMLSGKADALLLVEDRIGELDEAAILSSFAEAQGIPARGIERIGQVDNTVDEAERARAYLERHPGRTLLLITSARHMRRAAGVFRQKGLEPALLSTRRWRTELQTADFVPGTEGLEMTGALLYEMSAYAAYAARGYL